MKAILVIDMPTMCDECKLHYKDIDDSGWFHSGCVAKGKAYDNGSKMQDWCPLKPMPDGAAEHLIQGLDAIEKAKSVKARIVRETPHFEGVDE